MVTKVFLEATVDGEPGLCTWMANEGGYLMEQNFIPL